MVTKLLAYLSLLIIVLIVPTQQGSAHTVLKASGTANGGVIHITPDDDPIIGELSVITLEIKDSGLLNNLNSSYVRIYKPDLSTESPRTVVSGSVISASYTFESEGTYDIEIVLSGTTEKGSETTSTFTHQVLIKRDKKTGLAVSEIILFSLSTAAFICLGALLQFKSKHTS